MNWYLRGWEIVDDDGDVVALVTKGDKAARVSKMIAAAPKMHEALKLARRQMQNDWHDKPRIGMEYECQMIDLVLAEVDGRA